MRSSSSFESSSHGNFEQRRELFRALLSFFGLKIFKFYPNISFLLCFLECESFSFVETLIFLFLQLLMELWSLHLS
ncbi:phosphatase subunit g4-1 isoform X3 [Iris pallida]|uniref:Phosphatase subunit g4-1 isoform X3 n=1 Tax=Iris pallida TaxID=29817 RepID=A0AAX6DPZ8_IRIPA|nr:phosphatase subunit g4-1 isoform X3 [Iris pallida]